MALDVHWSALATTRSCDFRERRLPGSTRNLWSRSQGMGVLGPPPFPGRSPGRHGNLKNYARFSPTRLRSFDCCLLDPRIRNDHLFRDWRRAAVRDPHDRHLPDPRLWRLRREWERDRWWTWRRGGDYYIVRRDNVGYFHVGQAVTGGSSGGGGGGGTFLVLDSSDLDPVPDCRRRRRRSVVGS